MKSLALTHVFLLLIATVAAPLGWGCAGSLPPLEQSRSGPYHLDSGDQLRVIVFGQPDFSGSYTVNGSGRISMPLISAVNARGHTTAELEEAIGAQLSKGFVRSPNVSVQIEVFRPFFILGEVRRPRAWAAEMSGTVKQWKLLGETEETDQETT